MPSGDGSAQPFSSIPAYDLCDSAMRVVMNLNPESMSDKERYVGWLRNHPNRLHVLAAVNWNNQVDNAGFGGGSIEELGYLADPAADAFERFGANECAEMIRSLARRVFPGGTIPLEDDARYAAYGVWIDRIESQGRDEEEDEISERETERWFELTSPGGPLEHDAEVWKRMADMIRSNPDDFPPDAVSREIEWLSDS